MGAARFEQMQRADDVIRQRPFGVGKGDRHVALPREVKHGIGAHRREERVRRARIAQITRHDVGSARRFMWFRAQRRACHDPIRMRVTQMGN